MHAFAHVPQPLTPRRRFAYLVLLRFRLSKTYRMGDFYGSHIAPLAIQSLIMMSTFWQVGFRVLEFKV